MSDEIRIGTGSMSNRQPSDEEILQGWYLHAAQQLGSIGELFSLLRVRLGQSVEQQCIDFDIPDSAFSHLESLRAPRSDSFSSDALRIAEVCHVGQPFPFIQALLLARNLHNQIAHGSKGIDSETTAREAYEAAFDAIDGIDSESGGEDED